MNLQYLFEKYHLIIYSLSIIILSSSIYVFIIQSYYIYLKAYLSFIMNQIYNCRNYYVIQSLNTLLNPSRIPKNIPFLDNIEKVSDRTYRILGLNPGSHTLQGTNTWLIRGIDNDSLPILIDTGEENTSIKYVNYLLDEIFPMTNTKFLSKILLTHGHYDHQGGVQKLLEGLLKRNMLPLPTIHKCIITNGQYPLKGDSFCQHINDHEVFKIDSYTTLEAIYLPGHTDDHIGFILYEDSAIFSGDCILGCGTTVFDNLSQYMSSLQKLHDLIINNNHICGTCQNIPILSELQFGQVQLQQQSKSSSYNRIHTIYPGHGPIIKDTAIDKINEYMNHRNIREEQIYYALLHYKDNNNNNNNNNNEWCNSWHLADIVYGKMNLFIKLSAQSNLLQHLYKLLNENKIEFLSPDLWRGTYNKNRNISNQ